MSPETLTRQLRRRAAEAGFDACAVASAGRLERDGAKLEAWLARDRHAGMHWMAFDPGKRADPRELLPGCRSVVVLAMNYWHDAPEIRDAGERARVALYARGRDYHKVLARRLKELAAWIDERAGESSRVFVDTGPVLERGWAERAGLGWIGKNANLLTREMGSWLLLGEILSTAELTLDPGPHEDFCGTCTACIDGCPTRAIVAGRHGRLQSVHLLLDDRAPRSGSTREASGACRLDFRLRYLSGGLPVERQLRPSASGRPVRSEGRPRGAGPRGDSGTGRDGVSRTLLGDGPDARQVGGDA